MRLILKAVTGFFLYLWLYWVFAAAPGLSLVAASGLTLQSVHWLLTVMASLVAEHRLAGFISCGCAQA